MNPEQNKKAAIEFQTMLAAGKIDEAYAKHVDMGGKHHNFFFPAGFASLKRAMQESEQQFPNKRLSIKNTLADGDLVVLHSHIALKPGELEVATAHIYRFGDGKIVEMWDIGQQIPKDCPNADGPF